MQKIREQMGKITIILMLVLIYLIFIPPYILEDLSLRPFISSLLHHFFHANVFHLAVNCLCVWAIYNSKRAFTTLPIAFVLASLSYFAALRPVIGFSNILFASMGILTPSLSSRWWRSGNAIIFLVVNIAVAFIPSISATTHLTSFILGVMYAIVSREIRSIIKDLKYVSR